MLSSEVSSDLDRHYEDLEGETPLRTQQKHRAPSMQHGETLVKELLQNATRNAQSSLAFAKQSNNVDKWISGQPRTSASNYENNAVQLPTPNVQSRSMSPITIDTMIGTYKSTHGNSATSPGRSHNNNRIRNRDLETEHLKAILDEHDFHRSDDFALREAKIMTPPSKGHISGRPSPTSTMLNHPNNSNDRESVRRKGRKLVDEVREEIRANNSYINDSQSVVSWNGPTFHSTASPSPTRSYASVDFTNLSRKNFTSDLDHRGGRGGRSRSPQRLESRSFQQISQKMRAQRSRSVERSPSSRDHRKQRLDFDNTPSRMGRSRSPRSATRNGYGNRSFKSNRSQSVERSRFRNLAGGVSTMSGASTPQRPDVHRGVPQNFERSGSPHSMHSEGSLFLYSPPRPNFNPRPNSTLLPPSTSPHPRPPPHGPRPIPNTQPLYRNNRRPGPIQNPQRPMPPPQPAYPNPRKPGPMQNNPRPIPPSKPIYSNPGGQRPVQTGPRHVPPPQPAYPNRQRSGPGPPVQNGPKPMPNSQPPYRNQLVPTQRPVPPPGNPSPHPSGPNNGPQRSPPQSNTPPIPSPPQRTPLMRRNNAPFPMSPQRPAFAAEAENPHTPSPQKRPISMQSPQYHTPSPPKPMLMPSPNQVYPSQEMQQRQPKPPGIATVPETAGEMTTDEVTMDDESSQDSSQSSLTFDQSRRHQKRFLSCLREGPLWLRILLNCSLCSCIIAILLLISLGIFWAYQGEITLFGLFADRTAAPTFSPAPSTSSPTFNPTRRPTPNPTTSPTSFPSNVISSNPSINPTLPVPSSTPSTSLPSNFPSTSFPTTQPTSLPPTSFPSTQKPSNRPTTQIPSKNPSIQPSRSLFPTKTPPTARPTIGDSVTFFVTAGFYARGDLFYEFGSAPIDTELERMRSEDARFLVHLGNFNNPASTGCVEASYSTLEDVLSRGSNVPVFFTNGSEDYINCPNPFQAFTYWNQYFGTIERNWNINRYNVERMDEHVENFAFIQKRVLFLGIDVAVGEVNTITNREEREFFNFQWVKDQISDKFNFIDLVVIFGNGSARGKDWENIHGNFFRRLVIDVIDYAMMRTLYVHPTQENAWKVSRPFDSQYFTTVSVLESHFPFMKITVDPDGKIVYSYDQASRF